MIGGAAGAAIAAGPLIGGYVTTTWSWRYVFVGEVVVVIAVLAVHRMMKARPSLSTRRRWTTAARRCRRSRSD
jgi:MFS family permease